MPNKPGTAKELLKVVLKSNFCLFNYANAHQVFVFGNLWLILKN